MLDHFLLSESTFLNYLSDYTFRIGHHILNSTVIYISHWVMMFDLIYLCFECIRTVDSVTRNKFLGFVKCQFGGLQKFAYQTRSSSNIHFELNNLKTLFSREKYLF